PEAIINGFNKIQDLVRSESLRRRDSPEYTQLLAKYGIQ
ncbi:MAG: NADH-quinone oxidoreductase subunit B, partial [Methylotenera sp.]|nr:NADH-quinone oxidoreductase subunit B [Flavobacterium sp.]